MIQPCLSVCEPATKVASSSQCCCVIEGLCVIRSRYPHGWLPTMTATHASNMVGIYSPDRPAARPAPLDSRIVGSARCGHVGRGAAPSEPRPGRHGGAPAGSSHCRAGRRNEGAKRGPSFGHLGTGRRPRGRSQPQCALSCCAFSWAARFGMSSTEDAMASYGKCRHLHSAPLAQMPQLHLNPHQCWAYPTAAAASEVRTVDPTLVSGAKPDRNRVVRRHRVL